MNDPQTTLAQRFAAAIAAAFGDEHADTDPLIRPAQNPKFGDYQANVAMSLAKRVGKNPREVAAAIIDRLDVAELCETPDVAGPGFINLKLRTDYLQRLAADLAADPRLGVAAVAQPQTVVVDYSSPNVAKEMHVGHLRSTVIGDALARVLEFLGHNVIRQNHLGDWGTQFGMLIEYLADTGQAESAASGSAAIADLNQFYKQAKAKFDADEDFAERSRKRVVALQGGDEATRRLWQQLIEASKHHFNEAYGKLNVTLVDEHICGESFYNDLLDETVAMLMDKGIAVETEGAVGVFVPGFNNKEGDPVPLIVRKSDGGYGYAATDLSAIRYRVGTLHADRIAYVVDARQSDHFEQVFWTAEQAGWLDAAHAAEHVKFGTILGEDHKPFKTRAGETVRLADLLNEAGERAAAIIAEKDPEMDDARRAAVAHVVGIGAVKYGDLSSDRIKDYVFSWERMLAFEGNTAPYLQNAYVRARSILRKLGVLAEDAAGGVEPDVSKTSITLVDPVEHALVLKLVQLGDVVGQVAGSLEPHRLCNYLYELATAFHKFFEACPVMRAETDALRDSRAALCVVTARALRAGLDLLGIDVPERM
ncbi:MAG: arginine--tRNA ligase [Phycisphaera sp.]|nr:arginine--tRNA ligase [Phycisphaera sp.]